MTDLTAHKVTEVLSDQVAHLLPDVTIYINPNQQGTQLPAVFITPMTSNVTGQIGRDFRTLGFDLVYLEELDLPNLTERYIQVADTFDAGLDLIPYPSGLPLRTFDRKWFTELDALHYQIKVKVHVAREETHIQMQALERLTEEVKP